MKIDYHAIKEELKSEIEKEFTEVLKNTVLDSSANKLLFGEKFAFYFLGIKRTEHTIQFRFRIYRKLDLFRKNIMKKRQTNLGSIDIIVYLPKKRKRKREKYYS